jgi:elongation factor P
MLSVSDVKAGTVIRLEGRLFRVLEAVRHSGSGQMHGFMELKLKDLRTGHFTDRHFKFTEKLEEVQLVKKPMDFLYEDNNGFCFMDPETFEQIVVPKSSVGAAGQFLKEGVRLPIEFLGEEALAIEFPKIVELKVASTGPGIRDGQDNTMKPATLENGMEIMVPQFVETGDTVRVDTEKVKYVERVTTKRI